jgi:hypothetical protein
MKAENSQNSQELTIGQAISRAKKATTQGNIVLAAGLYEKILKHDPNNLFAKKQLRRLQKRLQQNLSAEGKNTKSAAR